MTQTTDAALVLEDVRALRVQNGALRSLNRCLEEEIKQHRAKAQEYHAATTTLDSEREANRILTDTIEAQARRIEALEGRAVVNDFQHAAFDVFAAKLDGRVIQVGFLPADQCLSDDGEKVSGFTLFPEDGSEPEIWISDDTPVRGVPDVLFHELAHVLAGIEAGHDERWKAIEDSLWADLDRICISPEPTP